MRVNDILNQKDINYLIDKITPYEDAGFDVRIQVGLFDTPDFFLKLYQYTNIKNETHGVCTMNFEMESILSKAYEKNGLCYIIAIGKNTYMWQEDANILYSDTTMLNEYLERLGSDYLPTLNIFTKLQLFNYTVCDLILVKNYSNV